MIERESSLQFLRCTICAEIKPLSRNTSTNPEEMFIAVEEMTADHKDCDRWKHNPARAARERGVKIRTRCLMRKLEAKKR